VANGTSCTSKLTAVDVGGMELISACVRACVRSFT
jgi:hypothetical protein